jgi:signal transduction histidine kinase
MARALEDQSLRIVFWRAGDPGRWVDESGWPVSAPERREGIALTEVEQEGRLVAAIEHDATLAQDDALMQAAASYALSALENQRLVRELRESVADLARSRARLVAVGDDVRRRLERDLHDGAQQRLVALRIQLALQSERLEGSDADAAQTLAQLGDDVEATIEEVRALARGIYPSLLSERGLTAALQAAARGSAIPAAVVSNGVERYPAEIETTVYFACLEAMQNAAKHAQGASRVDIALNYNGALQFEVRDDGSGFDGHAPTSGTGLTNLHDRLSAVGGELSIESSPGAGTRVTGKVPVPRS